MPRKAEAKIAKANLSSHTGTLDLCHKRREKANNICRMLQICVGFFYHHKTIGCPVLRGLYGGQEI